MIKKMCYQLQNIY